MKFLPTSAEWRGRMAIALGAVSLGLVALAFAQLADIASRTFLGMASTWRYSPLLVTPCGFALLAWLIGNFAPFTAGSGIPQVIAATHAPQSGVERGLISLRTAILKLLLTVGALLFGASVGREGPTVQVSAAIMTAAHRLFRVPLNAAIVIAGGAAGVSAAFNTPLAGVAFAIEELAAAYEQRVTLLVMAAIMISGLVSLGIAGDYVYFGAMHDRLPIATSLVLAPLAGSLGGACGGLFSKTVLAFGRRKPRLLAKRPILWAAACGLLVAFLGVMSGGLTWGTGYGAARLLVEGHDQPVWFGAAKFVSTLATTVSGLAGGIFAPSLAVGAGFGNLMHWLLPQQPAGPIILLVMIAYFVGVVRAPLTAVVIVSEMTDSRAMILPLFAAAIVADMVARVISPQRLYHGLAAQLRQPSVSEPVRPAE